MNKEQKVTLIRIIIAAIALLVLHFIPLQNDGAQGIIKLALYIAVYLEIGYDILIEAFEGVIHKAVFNEDFLMVVATIGAFALAIYTKSGDYNEAIAVMLFFRIGEFFEDYAVDKSRDNIMNLMDIRPDCAMIERDGETVSVNPDEVEVGSIIVVRVGDKVPIDGVIVEGSTSLNTVALTGESVPREAMQGDEVISGCINLSSVIKVRTTKAFGESTVSKILELVENSSENKAKSEDFISKFAEVYTPIVCFCSLALALLPPLVSGLFLGRGLSFGTWIYRALTFLVISCPCALVISIPLSFFAGIGGASKAGILIKGANYIEKLSKTSQVVMDKTGTLTKGVFEVVDYHHHSMDRRELLRYAALAEYNSTHPIAKSLKEAYGDKLDSIAVSDVSELGGYGVIATIDGHKVAVGNDKLMQKESVEYKACHETGTIVHVAIDGEYQGHIVISDVLKPHAGEAIDALKNIGTDKLVMLTGDSKKVADEMAKKLGIDLVYSELLPGDKVNRVEELLRVKNAGKAKDGETLIFVGDGINDAPVLARADVGMAMGAMGSDAAIEAADVVLMDDDPLKISKSIRIARKCMRIVYENICFAIGIKVICLLLGAFGIANMWMAIFADVGVMVIAVLNALRALSVKNL